MPAKDPTREVLKDTTLRLLAYCKANDWAGYDPYDALNSRMIRSLPIQRSKMVRLALTQIMKRSPIDLRRLFSVPKTQNPKALGLFLMALVKLSRLGLLDDENLIPSLVDRLEALRSSDAPYYCWGYSFPWQTRTILVPRGSPNLVCTVFVGKALLEAYRYTGSSRCLEMSRSAAEYLLKTLYWTDGPISAGFSYPTPDSRKHIYNADLLGAVLLCRIHRLTGDARFLGPALRAARYAALQQRDDGAWYYGESPEQRWIDNFHTGYNLSALAELETCGESGEFTSTLDKGFAFYKENFLKEGQPPKYFHDHLYPIDIHCVAQSIITLVDFKDDEGSNIKMAASLFNWARTHMWSDRGFFYYRVDPLLKNRISYMRWSQAWMLLALSSLLEVYDGRLSEVPQDISSG